MVKNKLQPRQGDIILAHNYGIFGWYVRIMTKNYWNHCLLYLGNGEVLDILGRGITKLDYNKYYKNRIDHKFIRVKGLSDYKRKKICDHALKFIGKGYNLGIVLGLRNKIGKYHCSQFIGKIFADNGIVLYAEPLTLSPADLDKSPKTFDLDNPPNRQKKLDRLYELLEYEIERNEITEEEAIKIINKVLKKGGKICLDK